MLPDFFVLSRSLNVFDYDTIDFIFDHSRRSFFRCHLARGGRIDLFLPNHSNFGSQELVLLFTQGAQDNLRQYVVEHGTIPPSKSAIEALPDIQITEETDCGICNETLEMATVVKQMRCGHLYYNDCLFHWFEMCNKCPVCRFELSTDDLEYESKKENLETFLGSTARRIGDSNLEEFSGLILLGNDSRQSLAIQKSRLIASIHQPGAH